MRKPTLRISKKFDIQDFLKFIFIGIILLTGVYFAARSYVTMILLPTYEEPKVASDEQVMTYLLARDSFFFQYLPGGSHPDAHYGRFEISSSESKNRPGP